MQSFYLKNKQSLHEVENYNLALKQFAINPECSSVVGGLFNARVLKLLFSVFYFFLKCHHIPKNLHASNKIEYGVSLQIHTYNNQVHRVENWIIKVMNWTYPATIKFLIRLFD